MDEEWRDVVGYEGLYKVSNLGNVYSCHVNRNLSAATHKDGYKFVILSNKGKQKYMMVHRLVAEAFIDNPDSSPIINHKDQNPANNNVDNLEWCDYVYNATYNDAHIKRGDSLSKHVYAYDNSGELIAEYKSAHEAERITGIHNSGIIASCRDDYRTCKGSVWSQKPLSKQEVLNRFKLNKEKKCETKSKKVNQYDLDGNFIKSYQSTQEAGRQLGFSPSLVSGVCRGDHKFTHGYVFKYA